MAIFPVAASTYGSLVELDNIGNSIESLVKLVDSQKELLHSQIDQLQRTVVTQCKLTGANPLAQEMAAGALSIKIGKRPRDLLNPKAIKYMQSLFSIKDTIGKKETREISALCGITVTQVRDYFTSQRSKVRKLVRLSQEKAATCNASKEPTDGCSSSPKQSVPASRDAPTNTSDLTTVGDCTHIPGNLENITSVCTESEASPVDSNSSCTEILGNSNNITGNLGYSQFLGNSGNVTTLCAQVLVNTKSVTALCTQAPGNMGNVSTVCPTVSGNLGSLSTVCTAVPGNLGIVSTTCAPVSGNLGNISTVFTPVTTVFTPSSGHPGLVTSVGTLVPGSLANVTPVQNRELVTMKTTRKPMEEGPSSSVQEESILCVDSDDKTFLENIFNLMRKEQTFSGWVKLMEWVLQIHNSAVLSWFSTKGGITILASWLSEAASEEQTTVLLVIFKVLCHLQLKKAQPAQMSAILQSVNRLRFYRNSDISNRAKVLLSRWSKMFVRSQALRNSRNSLKNGQKEMLERKRTDGVLNDKSWPSELDIPGDILAFAKSAEDSRETEPNEAFQLLTDSGDGSTRKRDRTVSATKIKERRKVLLVEQPDSKAGRSGSVARLVPSNTSRPMSADDIQKAKMRASFMQDKHGKSSVPTTENAQNSPQKAEDHKVPPASQGDKSLPASKIPPLLRRHEVRKSPAPITKNLPKPETSRNPKPNLTNQERLLEKLKRTQIPWRRPPEIKLNSAWRVGEGQSSKEVQVQTQRNQREKEATYQNPQETPPNPKEPWDVEMDFDDSLTPQVPIDQPPDPESPSCSPSKNIKNSSMVVEDLPSTSNNDVTEPDAELLVILLKNPEVVEVLTKGEGKNLSQEQLVALLDVMKKAGTGEAGLLNGVANGLTRQPEHEPEPVSLPSPTPPSDASRTSWRSEFSVGNNRGAQIVPSISLPSPLNAVMPIGINNNNQTFGPMAVDNNHIPRTVLLTPPLTVTVNPPPQQHLPSMYLPHQRSRTPETLIPSNHYLVNNLGSFNPPPPPIHSEPTLFLPKTQSWPNGILDDSAKNSNYCHNHNNHNSSNGLSMYPRRNDYVPESNTVVNPQELYGENYSSEPRRGFDRSHERARQRRWNHGQQRDHQYRGGGSGGGGRRRGQDNDRHYR